MGGPKVVRAVRPIGDAVSRGQIPPVFGFWSLTLYNAEHFFHPNTLNRYSLGTKNKTVKGESGWLTDALRGS